VIWGIGYAIVALCCVLPFSRAALASLHSGHPDGADYAFAAFYGLIGAAAWPPCIAVAIVIRALKGSENAVHH
jgi:hypothetical protein